LDLNSSLLTLQESYVLHEKLNKYLTELPEPEQLKALINDYDVFLLEIESEWKNVVSESFLEVYMYIHQGTPNEKKLLFKSKTQKLVFGLV
jgi:hypothetical protein